MRNKAIIIKPYQVPLTVGTVEKLRGYTGAGSNHEAIQIAVLDYNELFDAINKHLPTLKKLTGIQDDIGAIVATILDYMKEKKVK